MDEKRLVDGTTALAEKQPRVIKIEPTERPQNVRLRVAAYTRVSSDSEDQLNSFAAQNRYYTELISGKAEWRMVDIYADEGITGTSVAKRDDFQRMMADCRRGLIDQILVKSISRFARNTKDCLQNIRELKELGVNVRFEREGIDTVNVSSELITAIYAAFAQKESESISGNMRWSYQRRMESGEFNTCKAPWGFRLDGRKLKVYEPETDIVQRIFHEYLSGKNPQEIADDLNASCLTERVWNYKAVDYILQNERYAGNALLQKRYTPDMLSRQQKTNHGEREMYFVPGSNDAIISPELFERAQVLRQKRSLGKAPVHSEIISQIRCICGARMRFKNVNSKWYLCCTSHDTKGDCLITPVRETQIHASFCRLYYKLPRVSRWSTLLTLPGRCAAICGRFTGAASKLPQDKRNAVLGRLWTKEEYGCLARENHLLGGGQHRVCLVAGTAAARLPPVCGALPHTPRRRKVRTVRNTLRIRYSELRSLAPPLQTKPTGVGLSFGFRK